MKKLVTILILAAVAGGGAYYYYVQNNQVEPPQVVQVTIAKGNVTEAVQATGTLEALRTARWAHRCPARFSGWARTTTRS